jgi:hypothetical protein
MLTARPVIPKRVTPKFFPLPHDSKEIIAMVQVDFSMGDSVGAKGTQRKSPTKSIHVSYVGFGRHLSLSEFGRTQDSTREGMESEWIKVPVVVDHLLTFPMGYSIGCFVHNVGCVSHGSESPIGAIYHWFAKWNHFCPRILSTTSR